MNLSLYISKYNRDRKWNLFKKHFPLNESNKILDVGFSDTEYSEVDNYIEKFYPFRNKITALGVDKPNKFRVNYPDVKCVQYDGSKFPFEDKEFDICWSNAVIEHVGDFDKQVLFLQEINRVSKAFFLTTPNKYFPLEVHTRTPFLHYLPKKYFDMYLKKIGKEWATGNYMHLLSCNDLHKLACNAKISNYKIFKNKLIFITLDYVIISNK